jgi:hypothetical protein
MRWRRPYFDVDAYASGKHCSSAPCSVCGATATEELCETHSGQPSSLDIWYPLCFEHSKHPIPNWEQTTCAIMNEMVGSEMFHPKEPLV